MIFKCQVVALIGLVPLVIGPVAAFPTQQSRNPVLRLRDSNDDILKQQKDTCLHDLTKQIWVDGEYSETLQTWLRNGPADGGGWANPSGDGSAKAPDKSALDVDLGTPDTCSISSSDDGDNFPQAVTMLKAMSNFSNHMSNIASTITDTTSYVSGTVAEMMGTFGSLVVTKDVSAQKGPLGVPNGPLIMLGALIGLVPELGAVLAAPFYIAIGVNQASGDSTEVAFEPEFEASDDFVSMITKLGTGMSNSVKVASDLRVNGIPDVSTDDYWNWVITDKSALPQILEDGKYADPTSVEIGDDQKHTFKQVIYSAGISKIWNDSLITVVRTDAGNRGLAYLDQGTDLCQEGNDDNVIPWGYTAKYCDDGFMYTVVRFANDNFTVPGWDTLGDWGLDLTTVLKNSWTWYEQFGYHNAEKHSDFQTIVDITPEGLDKLDPKAVQPWFVPVCDLKDDTAQVDRDTMKGLEDGCDHEEYGEKHGGYNDARTCKYMRNLFKRCPGLKGWPLGQPKVGSPY